MPFHGGMMLSVFSSVQSQDRLDCPGGMRDDSAEILFQSFLQEAHVSSSGMGKDVHSLMLSIQHFLCRPRRCSPYKVPRGMVLEGLVWRVTCPNHASFRLLTVARGGSCGGSAPSRWSCAPSSRYVEISSGTWFRKLGSFFQSQQAGSTFHCRRMEVTRDV